MTTLMVEWHRPDSLFDKQREALFCGERFCITEGSVKSGKSSGALAWQCEQAIGGPEGAQHWWVSPSYSLSAEMHRRFRRMLPAEAVAGVNQSTLRVELVTGATVWFKSADRDSVLYGQDVASLVVDEAARIPERSWHAARSTLAATGGPARLLTNVAGKTWAWRLARQAESGELEDWGYHRLDWRDSVEAGILDESEVEAARASLPQKIFKQLYENRLSEEGTTLFDTTKLVVLPGVPDDPAAVKVRAWDLALGGARSDYTVGVLVMRDIEGECVIADMVRGKWPPEQALDLIAATAADDGRYVDIALEEEKGSAGRMLASSIQRRLEDAGIGGMVHSEKISGSKEARAYGLAGAIGAGQVGMVQASWNDDLRREMDSFPLSGEHDDIIDACSLAWNFLDQNPVVLGSGWIPGQEPRDGSRY